MSTFLPKCTHRDWTAAGRVVFFFLYPWWNWYGRTKWRTQWL